MTINKRSTKVFDQKKSTNEIEKQDQDTYKTKQKL